MTLCTRCVLCDKERPSACRWKIVREEQIFETGDPELVRKLHSIRARRTVFEREQRRWIITRITPGEPSGRDEPTWVVWGRTAKYSEMSDTQAR